MIPVHRQNFWLSIFIVPSASGPFCSAIFEFSRNEFEFDKNEFENKREKIPSHYDNNP